MKAYSNLSIFEKVQVIFNIILKRNKIICHDFHRKAVSKRVNLNYWQIDSINNKDNLGDYLSLVVYQNMLKKYKINENEMLTQTKHLYAIGSILMTGFQDCTVWGTGILHEFKNSFSERITLLYNKYFRKMDIRCVRGPKTREFLLKIGIDCPEKYGDPAVLMPLFYQPEMIKKSEEYIVIKHYTSFDKNNSNELNMLTKDYKNIIDKIYSSKVVISGSLHGIIIAEAYGVPAILLKDRKEFDLFKYEDYYFSTGRYEFPVVESVEEALNTKPVDLPDLSGMQEMLVDCFPIDLWNE